MKQQNFSELSTEALKSQLKSIKVITGILAFTLVLLFILSIIATIRKGFSPTLIIPFALSPILVVNYKNITNLKKELESRKMKQG